MTTLPGNSDNKPVMAPMAVNSAVMKHSMYKTDKALTHKRRPWPKRSWANSAMVRPWGISWRMAGPNQAKRKNGSAADKA